jgi:hypothetical protein
MLSFHEDSPSFKNEDEMTALTKTNSKVAPTERAMIRQSNIWRSIILSTLDETFKPYCVYIRTLDFRNLSGLLEDYKFSKKIRKDFFAGPMQQFKFDQVDANRTQNFFEYLDMIRIINAVGEAITTKSAHLEELHGHLSPGFLPQWIRNSPHLQSLTLYLGNALTQEAGAAFRKCAPMFKSLTISEWRDSNADEVFAAFLNHLNSQTLEYLEIISSNRLGELSFDALSAHATSLKELKLNSLSEDAMKNLDKLRLCTSIHILSLEDNTRGQVLLETDHPDVFVEIVAWLSACTKLKDVSMKNFFDGPAILARVLSSPDVVLDRLSLEGYELGRDSTAAFHTALSDQRQLKTVELKGTCEDGNQNHLTILVEALCNLQNLQTLRLKDISEDFEETHITNLALRLPMLEDFWTSGQNLGPDVLPVLASMKYLKTLNLNALTQFGCTDILDFVSQLDDETQRDFNLNLMSQDAEYNLTDAEQELIRDILRSKVDGKFDFDLWREDDEENSDYD